jgi:serine/threonine protein kinase
MDLIHKIGKNLKQFGFRETWGTVAEFLDWLKSVKTKDIPTLKKISEDCLIFDSIRFSEFQLAKSGNFGIIYLVYRENLDDEEDQKFVFIKTCPNHKTSLLIEGLIHTIAQVTLEHYGFPNAVPKIFDIVNHPELGPVFSVERIQNAALFADYLKYTIKWEQPCELNDISVFSVLAQVATYAAILEKAIGINHRDLKSDNVLMVVPQKYWSQRVCIDGKEWILHANYTAVIIDFGFSCIGKTDGTQVISAGEFFPMIDFCPKKGRDLFYMLSTLWNVKAFRTSLTEKAKKLFHKWLRDSSKRDWPNLLKLNSEHNLKEILLRSCSNDFQSESSEPLKILKDISVHYPQIIQFQ